MAALAEEEHLEFGPNRVVEVGRDLLLEPLAPGERPGTGVSGDASCSLAAFREQGPAEFVDRPGSHRCFELEGEACGVRSARRPVDQAAEPGGFGEGAAHEFDLLHVDPSDDVGDRRSGGRRGVQVGGQGDLGLVLPVVRLGDGGPLRFGGGAQPGGGALRAGPGCAAR